MVAIMGRLRRFITALTVNKAMLKAPKGFCDALDIALSITETVPSQQKAQDFLLSAETVSNSFILYKDSLQ